ncbi:MAG: hypothetical protein EAZ42_05035 [Verrucomicrobia bacterium]|nr:MAG: hypothetical protein EAZ42_05035 [Verrucomicrobiota bacterium]
MGDAAAEMHLLRDAEVHLGHAVWKHCENIEPISVEYWNLRKYSKEKEALIAELEAHQRELAHAHEERAAFLTSTPEVDEKLHEERIELLRKLEDLAVKRDRVVAQARDIKRSYEGLKMKLEVLTSDVEQVPDIDDKVVTLKEELKALKLTFQDLKNEKSSVAEEIAEGDAVLDGIDAQIQEKRKERRSYVSEAFQTIGDGNKEISRIRSEIGIIDIQMRQLYSEIGRYVSRNSHQNAQCKKAVQSCQAMVEVMRSLRRSISLNHRLAGTT